MNILEQLLSFNPHFRWSAAEAKKDIVFDKFRTDDNQEQHFLEKLQLIVDQDDSFDYKKGSSKIFKIKDYLKIIDFELQLVQSERNKIWISLIKYKFHMTYTIIIIIYEL